MTTFKRNIIKTVSNIFVVALFAASFSSVAYADYSTTTVLTTATTSGNFIVPQGVTGLTVSVVGGGGGGGGGAFTFAGGGGGSASAILNTTISVLPGQTIPYTVGVGGNGGYGGSMQFAGGNGGNGVSSTFGSTTANGGNGGQGAAYGNPSTGLGGVAGGVGGTNGGNGVTFFGQRVRGGNGGTNVLGTAGNGGSGNSASYVLATAGTVGAGGGGASGWQFNSNGTADAGARGGDGRIILDYYVDTTAPVITILGQNPATTTVGSLYVDAGATAYDNINGTTTVTVISNNVNTNVAGTYYVVYSATDLGGNNATATRTVYVDSAPVTDNTAPTAPVISTTTVATGIITDSVGISWFDSTDTETGVAYYLYLWDNSSTTVLSTTTPGATTTAATTTMWSTYGTYWFHAVAVDGAGNVSNTTTYGPFIVSNSNVLYVNSTIGGTLYTLFSPSLVQAEAASTTGTTTIVNSSLSVWWDINDSNVINTTINDAILNYVNATNSSITNADIAYCEIVNSSVKNYYMRNCYVAFSIVDPSTLYSFVDSTSTNSQIFASDIYGSTIDHSYVSTSTITDSTLSYSTTTDSTVTNSTSTNSQIASSTINVCDITSSSISSSTANGCVLTDSNINNSVLDTVTIDGSTVSSSTVSTSTVLDSTVLDSTVTDSALDGSTVTNSTVDESSVTDSTVSSSSITTSTITDSTITNSTTTNSTISSSTIDNSVISTSTISSSTISDATVEDATIIDDVVYNGTITYNGTTTVVSTTTPLSNLINYAPIAGFTTVINNLQVLITDTTYDANNGGVFPDAWTYVWDFGDGSTTTISATSTGQDTNHTYGADGTYTISLSVTDAYGRNSTSSAVVNITNTPDTVAPVITINGSNPASVVINNTYTDAGATATDNIDGTVAVTIISNNVNANALGTYEVVYSATDTAGNNATATRTVNVVATPDTTAPVITIIGSTTENVIVGGTYTDAGATAVDDVDGTIVVTATGTVDTTATGTYSIVYSATDSSGNTANATRTVNVIGASGDITAPVITITDGTPTTVLQNSTYTDAGATAFDNVDGTTTVTTVSNDVDTSATGTYSVVYSATDIAGNNATATRTVIVIEVPADTVAPVITITGGTPVSAILGSTYTDLGATAIDDVDGTTTVTTVSNDVDTAATGTYSVVYSATDIAGNTATATRMVNVVEATTTDIIAPVITITGGTPITISVGTTYTDAGATAIDDVDGTTTVTTVSNDVDSNTVGTYSVVYSATDIAGNTATATRTVNVISGGSGGDITAPVITIIGGTPTTVLQNSTYTDAGATAFDNVDGTTTVSATGTVDTSATGTYFIIYSSTDVAGNTGVATRTVNVIEQDTIAPVITVLGANPMTITEGLTYVEPGAVAVDNFDGTIAVTINGTVNTSATGTYTIIYSATDSSGNSASTTRTVNVVADTEAPVITILGSNPVSIVMNSTYTDAGATAFDNVGGTTTVSATGTVDTTATGTYSIVYSATDLSGNTATATRTVTVVEAPSSAKQILSFNFNGLTPVVTGTINQASRTVALTVPSGTVVTNLVPTIALSLGATVNPASGVAQNFTSPVVYTVTAQDSSTTTYTVTVIVSTSTIPTTDTTAPIITILGSNPVTLTAGTSTTYSDAGATAFDNVDGTTTVTTVSNNVNTTTAGIYYVVYSSTDLSGNTGYATRTVNVNAANNGSGSNNGGGVGIYGGVPGPYVPPVTPNPGNQNNNNNQEDNNQNQDNQGNNQDQNNQGENNEGNNNSNENNQGENNQGDNQNQNGNGQSSYSGGNSWESVIPDFTEDNNNNSQDVVSSSTEEATTSEEVTSNKSLVATVFEALSNPKAIMWIVLVILFAIAIYLSVRYYREQRFK